MFNITKVAEAYNHVVLMKQQAETESYGHTPELAEAAAEFYKCINENMTMEPREFELGVCFLKLAMEYRIYASPHHSQEAFKHFQEVASRCNSVMRSIMEDETNQSDTAIWVRGLMPKPRFSMDDLKVYIGARFPELTNVLN